MCRRLVSVGSVAKVFVLLRFSGPSIFSMVTENQGSLFRAMDTPEPPSKDSLAACSALQRHLSIENNSVSIELAN